MEKCPCGGFIVTEVKPFNTAEISGGGTWSVYVTYPLMAPQVKKICNLCKQMYFKF